MWAAAGILIPVVIHLWNRKKGKVLKVGSIALLMENPKQPARSFRLEDLLLLVLRCMLIILAAMVLSKPVWMKELHPEKEKGWILMERKGMAETYIRYKQWIDSLLKAQYTVHYFEPPFEKVDVEALHNAKNDSLPVSKISYWSLLRSLNQQVPEKLPVYLFTTNQLQRFAGSRPVVNMNLMWYNYTPSDSISTWVVKAYATTADSLRIVVAQSKPSGTVMQFRNASLAPQQNVEYSVRAEGQRLLVDGRKGEPVVVDTNTMNVAIYTDQYIHDAGYVKAAIEAIQQYSKRKIKIIEVHDPSVLAKQKLDWIFWLSEKTVPIESGQHIVVYEPGKIENMRSFFAIKQDNSSTALIELYKRIAYRDSMRTLEPVWKDGYGMPLLTLEKGNAWVYHFYSRFDPAWSDLTWSKEFPQMLYHLILGGQDTEKGYDKRKVDEAQLQPEMLRESRGAFKEKLLATHDLSKWFWLAGFLILFIERMVTYRNKKEKSNA